MAHPERFEQLKAMRPSAWFSVARAYGLNGFSYASYETIAQESKELNIPMNSTRAHSEKWVGLYLLGYKCEFRKSIKQAAQKTLRKWEKEKKIMEKENQPEEIEVKETEPTKPTTGVFQKTIDSIQSLIDENTQKFDELNKSFSEKDKERNELSETINELSKKLETIKSEVESQLVKIDTIGDALSDFLMIKEKFEKINN